jgi:valyl-tRNA synthetase
MEFGTGAVKITPAHDADDYECGKRHELEFINVLNDDGTLNENAGVQFQGMKRFHARIGVIEALKTKGLYVDSKDNAMQLPVCSKSGDMIEMLMKPQWWIDFKDAFPEVLRQMANGNLDIRPKSCASELSNWLANPQDWCVSRQLWWGHRIPAYKVVMESTTEEAATEKWVVGRTETEAREAASKMTNGQSFTLLQDEDVLDTWFSAGLWPFGIMGWPDSTPDLEKFYPSQMLETGWDILPFWVLRMVLLGYTLTGQIPFKEVLCHPLIRDPEGRKMSKSLGNVIDPVDIIEGIDLKTLHDKLKQGNLPDHEIQRAVQGQKKLFPKGISQCGTDALRFGLCNYMTGGKCYSIV